MKCVDTERRYVIGLMSGTSGDGIDAALVRIGRVGDHLTVSLEKALYEPYQTAERARIFAAFSSGFSAAQMGALNRDLGFWFARAVHHLLEEAGVAPDAVQVIGCHGQTIVHCPPGQSGDGSGFSIQIGDPAVIAGHTGIDVVSHFRANDMALGGQGAPMIPYFDYALFHSQTENRVILNIGGIANVTILNREMGPLEILGFDTGPGNMVLDGLTELATQGRLHYDRDGELARSGHVQADLLQQWLRHPYFDRHPPKSCGREQFGQSYCAQLFRDARLHGLSNADLLRTATELVGVSIARAIQPYVRSPWALIVSGGGIHNPVLMEVVEKYSHSMHGWESTEAFGVPGDFKEAMGFALFAWEFCQGVPTNVPCVTGARRLTMQGSWTPARTGTRLYGGAV